MRHLIKYLFMFAGLSLLSSCMDIGLEDEPREIADLDNIFDPTDPEGANAQLWVTGIYGCLQDRFPSGDPKLLLEVVSDDAVPSAIGVGQWQIIRNGYSPVDTYDDCFNAAYEGIRKANIFINNYQRVNWRDKELMTWLVGESRFLRVFFYWTLLQRYGGVPLIGDQVFTLNDNLQLPRNTFDECVKYMVDELDDIKDMVRTELPVSQKTGTSDPFFGRVRTGAVLALKAKILLLAASPLHNPSNDLSKWGNAAEAAKAVIDLKAYQLDNQGNPIGGGESAFHLEPDRQTLVAINHRSNKEVIFSRNTGSDHNRFASYWYPVGFFADKTQAEGRISPTQELVDAFEMKSTGEPFDWNNPVHRANPYNDRDPRLEQTVFYNGMKWRSETVDTYEGGKDITMENNGIKTVTGYYMRKFLPNDQGQKGSAFPSCNPVWNYIRLADVYLMYAEAINEAQDSKTNRDLAKTYVDLVRKRVSMPVLKDDLNQAQMREAIQHERRVELAFEEQRYFDIRRWKIAHKVYGSTDQSVKLHGVTITRDAGSNFVYTLKVVATPYFDNNSMNLYPFKRDEILTNGNLEQNPGY